MKLLQCQGRKAEADQWTGKAAEAAYLYGSWFEQRKRDTDAELWYRKAAEVGNYDAAFELGMLLNSQGSEESKYWIAKAAEGGHRMARFVRGDPSGLNSSQ